MKIHTVILAAGEGSRMLSNKAKSLQPLGGQSMLRRIYANVADITHSTSFVVGFEKDSVLGIKRKRWHKSLNKDVYIDEALNVLSDLRFSYLEN